MGGAAGPPVFKLARLLLAGGALTYGALNSLFNVEGVCADGRTKGGSWMR
jgi:hypothetical protein